MTRPEPATGQDLYLALLNNRTNKKIFYRRKKRHAGKDWRPDPLPTEDESKKGIWCRRCNMRHPYNGRDRLGANYEQRSDHWIMMWVCPNSGDVLREDRLGSTAQNE